MMDETSDMSHKRNLLLYLPAFYNVEDTDTGPSIQEKLQAMIDTQNLTGEGLTSVWNIKEI